jgi:hypothetical protein
MRLRVASAALILAAAAVAVREGHSHGDTWFGLVVWAVFLVIVLLVGAALLVLASFAWRRRPSRALWSIALLAALVLAFPVGASWDTVEGPDTSHGLVPLPQRLALAVGLSHDAAFAYSDTCCG